MIDTVLIANRGEIAVRVIRTLRDLGIRSVAVYSDADANARHVREADVAVRIGPAAARESYLSVDAVLAAAKETGAQAIHPGYGFLAENAEFARACHDAGIVFIGPGADAIDAMGDKIRAKETVSAAGVPVVPGTAGSPQELLDTAAEVGYPILLKPSAGGGGKGMVVVNDADELPGAIESAQRTARSAFGDDRLLAERFITKPRHIEIQVLADAHGNVIHLGERECSLQRRHQKIIEEAPSALLDEATRQRMGESACAAARAVDYVGAGTVEFIVSADKPDEFFFMEMNTRLQVEHPVTEMVTGIDLVEQQLKVAAGEPLALAQEDVVLSGHAIEARVYAEDPAAGFLPTGGVVLDVAEPVGAPGVRIDSGIEAGSVVGTDYDPMLAKVIAHSGDRAAALSTIDNALAQTAVLGIGTNVAFLRALLDHDDVRAGTLDTQLVDRELDAPTQAVAVPDAVFVAAALDELRGLEPAGDVVDPWDTRFGWRLGPSAGIPFRLECAGRAVTVDVHGGPDDATVSVDGGDPVTARAAGSGRELTVRIDGARTEYVRVFDPASHTLWLAAGGNTWAIAEHSLLDAAAADDTAGGPVVSPMPGSVLVVHVREGDDVSAGQPLLVVEAMKMEHTITAPVDGVVTELTVQPGQKVAHEQALAVVTPAD